jgi:hypothetical protein
MMGDFLNPRPIISDAGSCCVSTNAPPTAHNRDDKGDLNAVTTRGMNVVVSKVRLTPTVLGGRAFRLLDTVFKRASRSSLMMFDSISSRRSRSSNTASKIMHWMMATWCPVLVSYTTGYNDDDMIESGSTTRFPPGARTRTAAYRQANACAVAVVEARVSSNGHHCPSIFAR